MIERWVLARRLPCTSYRRDSRVETANCMHSGSPKGVHVREIVNEHFCGELPRGGKCNKSGDFGESAKRQFCRLSFDGITPPLQRHNSPSVTAVKEYSFEFRRRALSPSSLSKYFTLFLWFCVGYRQYVSIIACRF